MILNGVTVIGSGEPGPFSVAVADSEGAMPKSLRIEIVDDCYLSQKLRRQDSNAFLKYKVTDDMISNVTNGISKQTKNIFLFL
jgi:hypothetical protein